MTTDATTVPMRVPDNRLVSFSESDRTMYVTAVVYNMSGDQWEMIVVGSGSNITTDAGIKYYNAPLNRAYDNFIFVRAYAYSHSDSVRQNTLCLYLFKVNIVESKICIKWLVRCNCGLVTLKCT